jgi:hypothetical protein
MAVTAIGAMVFWCAWAAWSGAHMIRCGATLKTRSLGSVVMVAGLVGALYGLRIILS